MCLFYAKSLLCTIVEKYTASCTYMYVLLAVYFPTMFLRKREDIVLFIFCAEDKQGYDLRRRLCCGKVDRLIPEC